MTSRAIRYYIIVLFCLPLAGCFKSDAELIDASNAAWPFQQATILLKGGHETRTYHIEQGASSYRLANLPEEEKQMKDGAISLRGHRGGRVRDVRERPPDRDRDRPARNGLVDEINALPNVTPVTSPYDAAGNLVTTTNINADRTVGFFQVPFDKQPNDIPNTEATKFVKTVTGTSSGNITVAVTGQLAENATNRRSAAPGSACFWP